MVKLETYTHTFDREGVDYAPLVYDITLAKFLIEKTPREAILATVSIDREAMAEIAERNDWNEAHLTEVDIADPGIGAPFLWNNAIEYLLIDGTHRCVRAMREGKTFRAHLLSDDAAKRCLISADKRLLPWSAA